MSAAPPQPPSILAGLEPAALDEPGLVVTLAGSGEDRTYFGAVRRETWLGIDGLRFDDGSFVACRDVAATRPTTRREADVEAAKPDQPVPVVVANAAPLPTEPPDQDVAHWSDDEIRSACVALGEKEAKTGQKLTLDEAFELARLAAILQQRGVTLSPPASPAPTPPVSTPLPPSSPPARSSGLFGPPPSPGATPSTTEVKPS